MLSKTPVIKVGSSSGWERKKQAGRQLRIPARAAQCPPQLTCASQWKGLHALQMSSWAKAKTSTVYKCPFMDIRKIWNCCSVSHSLGSDFGYAIISKWYLPPWESKISKFKDCLINCAKAQRWFLWFQIHLWFPLFEAWVRWPDADYFPISRPWHPTHPPADYCKSGNMLPDMHWLGHCHAWSDLSNLCCNEYGWNCQKGKWLKWISFHSNESIEKEEDSFQRI